MHSIPTEAYCFITFPGAAGAYALASRNMVALEEGCQLQKMLVVSMEASDARVLGLVSYLIFVIPGSGVSDPGGSGVGPGLGVSDLHHC